MRAHLTAKAAILAVFDTVPDESLTALRCHAEEEAAIRRTLARISQELVRRWNLRTLGDGLA